ncbi:CDP-alcohol phosphatidyltransferase family protein [Streptomyces sp. TRM70350]|nr:CDP-alcohol phosphatidyltransferase family protein [Streptomyces sp. TRM70350]
MNTLPRLPRRPEDPVVTMGSREATDALLAALREDGWRPAGWARFLGRAARRSAVQAARRPRALAEVTALHGAVLLLSRGRGRRWITVSWALAAAHLGMLEQRSRLSAADLLTLCRASLPVLGTRHVRWIGIAAIATDLADGRLARRRRTVCPFGTYADHLADAAFWTWLVMRHKPSRHLRTAALAAWAAPVVTVTACSLARGRMAQAPRPAVLRPAAAMQALIALRRLRNGPPHRG